MTTLHLLDLRCFLHAGNVNKRSMFEGEIVETDKGYDLQYIPAGGLSFLFNTLHEHVYSSDVVICADEHPTYRIEIEPEYKANRSNSSEVNVQNEIVSIICDHVGINLISVPKFEADDVIYSLRKSKESQYDKIEIHTSDSDIAMNVSEKTSIVPVRSNDKHIDINNYSLMLSKEREVAYNTCNYWKMIHGDRGDNYKGIKDINVVNRIQNLLTNPLIAETVGDSELFEHYIKAFAPEALDRFHLAYPKKLDCDFNRYIDFNPRRFFAWGYLMGNKHFADRNRRDMCGEEIKEVEEILKGLFGKYATSRRQ